MVGYLPFGLLSAVSFHLVRAVPADPADPTITSPAVLPLQARQQDAAFIGYLKSGDSWASEACNSGLTWYENGNYAQCCPTTLASCPAATACISGSQVYPLPNLSKTSTIACTENYGSSIYSFCNTILIYENTLDSNPKTNINCGNKNVRWSYYRDVDTAVPSSTAIGSGSGSGRITDSASKSTAAPTSVPAEKSKGSSSKAWIAGAVVGPILGLALIGLIAFLIIRRKKKTKPTPPPQYGAAMAPATNPSQPPAGVAGYTDTKPQFASPHQSTYYDQSQTGTYPQQGGFGGDVSPGSHYATPVPGPVPYGAPSPPPMSPTHGQPVYGNATDVNGGDTKMAYNHTQGNTHGAVELGSETAPPLSPASARPVSYAPPAQGSPVAPAPPAQGFGAELQGSTVR